MAIKKDYRAVDQKQTQSQQEMLRDVRPLHQMVLDGFNDGTISASILFVAALAPFVEPLTAIPLFLFGLFVYWRRRRFANKDRLPMRVPLSEGKTDYSDILPGRRGYSKGMGVFYFGRDEHGRELWIRASDMLTHMLVIGTTGSGKTVTLTAMASNYLAMGGGFVYTDPKAAPGLWRNIHVMCRMFGRDDDLRVTNFMTANSQVEGAGGPERRTHTQNPFSSGNADQLTQLLTSLIEVSGGDNAVFGQNAMMAASALMLGLVEKRNNGDLELSITTIRTWFTSKKMIELACDPTLKPDTAESVKSFLRRMGWVEGKEFDKQPRSFGEQFQYAAGYFGMALNMLSDTYGHIYRHGSSEVDMFDVIKNRRILLNMLPSLEKSPAELKQIGKVTLSSIRNATAVGLGGGVEGRIDDVTNSLPLASPVPFGVLTDEYAAIPTPGFAEIMTQGRGIGISSITGTQDLDGMYGETPGDKKGAMQIIENTNIKLGMRLKGAGETWNLWKGLADEALVMQSQGYSVGGPQNQQQNKSMFDTNYRDQQSASLTKVSLIDLKDFQQQNEGEFHAFFNGEIIRGDMFFDPIFDDPKGLKINIPIEDYNLKLIRLAYVTPPDANELESKYGQIRTVIEDAVNRTRAGNYPTLEEVSTPFARINKIMRDLKDRHAPAEMMVSTAFLDWIKNKNSDQGGQANKQSPNTNEEQVDTKKEIEQNNNQNDVAPKKQAPEKPILHDEDKDLKKVPSPASSLVPVFGNDNDGLDNELKDDLAEEVSLSTPDKHPTKEMMDDDEQTIANDIASMEQATGIKKEQSEQRAQSTINKVKASTTYPNKPEPSIDDTVSANIDDNIDKLLNA